MLTLLHAFVDRKIVDFFLLHDNTLFTGAFVLLLCLTIVEAIGLLVATSPSSALDALIPDLHVSWAEWLYVGKVPVLVLFTLFLLGFCVSGFVIQAQAQQITGSVLPGLLAALPAAVTGILTTRFLGRAVAALIPSAESSAVSTDEFIGATGTVILGTARVGSPAEMKLTDRFGNTHYIRIEPDSEDDFFERGDQVLVLRKRGFIFTGSKA